MQSPRPWCLDTTLSLGVSAQEHVFLVVTRPTAQWEAETGEEGPRCVSGTQVHLNTPAWAPAHPLRPDREILFPGKWLSVQRMIHGKSHPILAVCSCAYRLFLILSPFRGWLSLPCLWALAYLTRNIYGYSSSPSGFLESWNLTFLLNLLWDKSSRAAVQAPGWGSCTV